MLDSPTSWNRGNWLEGETVFNAYRLDRQWRYDVTSSDIADLGIVLPSIRYVRGGVVRLDERDVVALRLSAERV